MHHHDIESSYHITLRNFSKLDSYDTFNLKVIRDSLSWNYPVHCRRQKIVEQQIHP